MKTSSPAHGAPLVVPSRFVLRFPFFYGWVVFLVATFGMIMTSPGQTYSVSIFIEHFIVDLGISRSVVSTLYTIGTLVGSFALPFVGRQIDRRGVRIMVLIVSLLFGLACIYMGTVRNALMLGAGFVAIRMLGQGSLGLISTNAINQWWVRRRGTVLGLSGLISSLLGIGSFPSLINWMIPQFGWRTTYMMLGVALLLIMAPVGYLFLRNRPEEYGLLPDGRKRRKPLPGTDAPGAPGVHADADDDELEEENWTLAEAIRTPAYWVFSLGLASISMLGTGLMFHIVSIFDDNGLSATLAASAFVPVALTTAFTTLGSGIIVDRIPVRVLVALALLGQATSLLMVQFLDGLWLAVAFGLVLGITSGLMRTVSTVVWAMYFGRLHLGSITGTTTTIMVGASALGPMPMGIARDVLGSYNTTLNFLAILPLVLGVAALFISRPSK